MQAIQGSDIKHPLNLTDAGFVNHKRAYYKWLRDEPPVDQANPDPENLCASRYQDCVEILRDPRFDRNQTTATGGSRSSISATEVAQVVDEFEDHGK